MAWTVEDEVDEHLAKLRREAEDGRDGVELGVHPDGEALPPRLVVPVGAGEREDLLDEAAEVEQLEPLPLLVADVLLDLPYECRTVARGPLDGSELGARLGGGLGERGAEQLGVAEDGREEVVEVVRDAHRHLPEHLDPAAARLVGRPRDRLLQHLARDDDGESALPHVGEPHGHEVQQHRPREVVVGVGDEEHLVRDELAARGVGDVRLGRAHVLGVEPLPERAVAEGGRPRGVGVEPGAVGAAGGDEEVGGDVGVCGHRRKYGGVRHNGHGQRAGGR